MNRNLKTWGKAALYWAFIPALLIIFYLIWSEISYQQDLTKTVSTSPVNNRLVIESGTAMTKISDKLAERGFIIDAGSFLKYLKRNDFDRKIQAGVYYLARNMTIPELAKKLLNGSADEIKVTLLEGWTNSDIDAYLTKKNLITAGEFINCVNNCDLSDFAFLPKKKDIREGFFWTDTYYVNPAKFKLEQFTKLLLRTYDQRSKKLLNGNTRNGWDILRMASIIEKEATGDLQERKLVAGVLWKRLDNGWLLGADATTRYITKKNKGEDLTVSDLGNKNPWNTRASKGLPPGAICNPGLSAIEAAANPEDSQYWYYLHGSDGQIHFAIDEAEHNKNKLKYLN